MKNNKLSNTENTYIMLNEQKDKDYARSMMTPINMNAYVW